MASVSRPGAIWRGRPTQFGRSYKYRAKHGSRAYGIAGRMNAAAALAIVAEKLVRSAALKPGAAEIAKPARYFLSMLYRSPKGELHLAPTLRALAKSAMN